MFTARREIESDVAVAAVIDMSHADLIEIATAKDKIATEIAIEIVTRTGTERETTVIEVAAAEAMTVTETAAVAVTAMMTGIVISKF